MPARQSRSLPHALAALILLVFAATLAGCGGIGTRLQPPAASIQQLTAQSDGTWAVVLRLQNNSYDTEMFVRSVDVDLSLGGEQAGHITLSPRLDIAAMDADVATGSLTPSPAGRAALAGSRGSAIAYELKGTMSAGKDYKSDMQTFDVNGSGFISPVPGVSNIWR